MAKRKLNPRPVKIIEKPIVKQSKKSRRAPSKKSKKRREKNSKNNSTNSSKIKELNQKFSGEGIYF